jgi:hypothetical protein
VPIASERCGPSPSSSELSGVMRVTSVNSGIKLWVIGADGGDRTKTTGPEGGGNEIRYATCRMKVGRKARPRPGGAVDAPPPGATFHQPGCVVVPSSPGTKAISLKVAGCACDAPNHRSVRRSPDDGGAGVSNIARPEGWAEARHGERSEPRPECSSVPGGSAFPRGAAGCGPTVTCSLRKVI